MLKSFPFHKWGVLCSERWSNLPKVTWLMVKREWKPVSVIQSLCSIYSLFCVRARQAASLCPLWLLLPYWVDSEAPSSLTERLTYLTAFSISQANLTKQPDQKTTITTGKPNTAKVELKVFSPKSCPSSHTPIPVDGITIYPIAHSSNSGYILNISSLLFSYQIHYWVLIVLPHWSIVLTTLTHAITISCLDYCKSLLTGIHASTVVSFQSSLHCSILSPSLFCLNDFLWLFGEYPKSLTWLLCHVIICFVLWQHPLFFIHSTYHVYD